MFILEKSLLKGDMVRNPRTSWKEDIRSQMTIQELKKCKNVSKGHFRATFGFASLLEVITIKSF